MQDHQTSKAFQDDNYCTAICDDDFDDTVQFSHPTIPVKKCQSTHYRGRLLTFYTDVSRLFT